MNKTNKLFWIITFILLSVLFLAGCVSSASGTTSRRTAVANTDELDLAIREASDYLNGNIPKGNKIVIINIKSESTALSNYIMDELMANAVNDRIFTVVDRQQLDTIRAEQNFQLSGDVADDEALAIGRFFGAQTIVSGTVSFLGNRYRMIIRALDVQTAAVQGQFNKNLIAWETISTLIQSDGTSAIAGTVPMRTTAQSRDSSSLAERTFEDVWEYFGYPEIFYWEDNKNQGFIFYRMVFNSDNLQAVKTYWGSLPNHYYREIWKPTPDNSDHPEIYLRFVMEYRKDSEPAYLNILIGYPDKNGMGEHFQLVRIVPGRVMEIIETMLGLVK